MLRASLNTDRPGTQRPLKRSGAALVEMAAVVVVLMMLLFGIVEYCRLIFTRQLITNAAREGARFAVVNTTEATVEAETLEHVKKYLGSMAGNLKNYKCQVYKADASGVKTASASEAQFGQYVAVEITCDFDPILPSLLYMKQTIKLQSKSLMYSEAN